MGMGASEGCGREVGGDTCMGSHHCGQIGNNSVYCSSSGPNCESNSLLSGFNAGSHYNLATGKGGYRRRCP